MTEDPVGVAAWKERTSAFDRVRSVAGSVDRPRSVSDIADEAHVAENTARNHLDRLVDMNVLLESERDGTARYEPDPLHARFGTLRDLLDEYDRDGLIELKADLQERIESWQAEYEVDSPDELRALAAETDTAGETRTITETIRDWELVAYRLGIVEDAIAEYRTYSRGSHARV